MTLGFDTLAVAFVALIALRFLIRAAKHDLGRADRLRDLRNRRLATG